MPIYNLLGSVKLNEGPEGIKILDMKIFTLSEGLNANIKDLI